MIKKLTFLSDRWIVLNFGPSRREYFSLRKDSLQAKIGVKMDKISQKYWNLNKIFTVFFKKLAIFYRLRTINWTDWTKPGMSKLDHLEEQDLS